ncbi:hypothetical protein [Oleiagrimonas sp. C23AA]|uniref:hypothetical protein n=1 Tax=Oleiagrimonas sp. C23AA TaxID=2719047 RepID=UPI00141E6876|nr:hypothetical protein [Oleiagrimonas sp. C23AA]NII10609.1 hypothetical protein [Oleiagrimonas sp. C23AA]
MASSDLTSCPAVLALELAEGSDPGRPLLERDEAETLAGLMAEDLRQLLPEVERSQLAVAGAHFDAVELLRPGFPTWTALDELAVRVPRGKGNVIAFGAHQGHMPAEPLAPDMRYAGSPMRLVPWTLLAPPELGQALGEAMEVELVGRGEAGTRTADYLMRTLGLRLEHARYLSRHDLMAMTCVQYEHMNLAALWTLIEAALLTPYREEHVLSARGLAMDYVGGVVQAQTPLQWLAGQSARADLSHDLAAIIFELRQHAALLEAHRLPLDFPAGDYDPQRAVLHLPLAEADPALGMPQLVAHQAPGLGTVVVSVVQRAGGRAHVLAHAIPLGGGLNALLADLGARYDCAAEAEPLGCIMLDAHGQLGAPVDTLH